MKTIIPICILLLFLSACSGDEDESSIIGNTNTLLKEATISNDTEGTRYYTHDDEYKLIQIKNDVKTITFSYYPPDEYNYCLLKSIIWKSGAVTKKLDLTYIENALDGFFSISLNIDGQTLTGTGSTYEEDWNFLKLDFGTYYELIRMGAGVKSITKFNSETGEMIKNQSFQINYYEPGTHSVDYGYGRSSDKTWMLYYLDKEEFFKFPLTHYAVDYIENYDYDDINSYYFRQHSHQFDKGILLSTKIHQEDDTFFQIDYKFEKLQGKTD
jgi:hypothetical protein